MKSVLNAELRRASTSPSNGWLLLATVAVGVLGTLASLLTTDPQPAVLLAEAKIREAMHGAAGGAVLVAIAGIIAMAGDWRFGQATQSFLTTPRRSIVVWARAIVYSVVGIGYGVIASIGATLTAYIWYQSHDVAFPLGSSTVWLTIIGCIAVATLFGVLGIGIGAVSRQQTVAIVATLAWMVLVEPALFQASPKLFRWLPGMAALSLRGMPSPELLPVLPATLVVVGIVAGSLVLGMRLVNRDDISA